MLALGCLAAPAVAAEDATEPATARASTETRSDSPFDTPLSDGGLIKSMGMPPRFKPFVSISGGSLKFGDENEAAGYLTLGVFKDLVSPTYAAVRFGLEGYGGPTENGFNGGARALLQLPFLRIHTGMDYNITEDSWDWMLSLVHPIRRGGVFGRGSSFRVDWWPGRGNSFQIGFQVPLIPHQGKTRTRTTKYRIPGKKVSAPAYRPEDDALAGALLNVRDTAHWINRLTTPFLDFGGNREDAMEAYVATIGKLKTHLAKTDDLFPEGRSSLAEVRAYHDELDRAFSIAESGKSLDLGESTARGRELASAAKAVLLQEVIFPYNRLLGQMKKNDSVMAFSVPARAAFANRLAGYALPKDQQVAAKGIFEELLQSLERIRAFNRKEWKDSRYAWLPLQLALRAEEHDTQEEMNNLIGRAVGEGFTRGNRVWYIINEQFQWEVARMVRSAEDYHVLWIHDVRSVDGAGNPDEMTFLHLTNSYLETLAERVRHYDETGKLPVYMIIQDQMFFENNKSRAVHKILQDPLGFKIPRKIRKGAEKYQYMIDGLADAQAELRAAVAGSKRLQADAARYGKKWLENRVKIHINITTPADESYWTQWMIPIVGLVDTPIRDHRKISFYDVTEEDPYKGMGAYSGMGLGEHYTGGTWEDRGVLVQGPSLISLKRACYDLLRSQGFKENEIPYPLRPKPRAPDYDARVRAVASSEEGDAPGLQLHNTIGWGPKPLSVFKASLYNLMPAGSALVVPDFLWTNPFWESMLVGSGLRGGRAFIIAPSVLAHPSAGNEVGKEPGAVLSVSQEILARMIVFQQLMKDELAAAGGMIKTGLYEHELDVKDLPGLAKLALERAGRNPFLREQFNMHPSVRQRVMELDDVLEDYQWSHLFDDASKRHAKLHMKVNYFSSKEGWDILSQPGMADVFEAYFKERAEQLQNPLTYNDVRVSSDRLTSATNEVWDEWLASHDEEARERAIFYMTVGSVNQDDRAMFLDGEVAYIVAGPWATVGLLDMVMLLATANWVETLEELEEYIPTYGGFVRSMGRWMRKLI